MREAVQWETHLVKKKRSPKNLSVALLESVVLESTSTPSGMPSFLFYFANFDSHRQEELTRPGETYSTNLFEHLYCTGANCILLA